jgi:hypothetical protein
MPNETTTDRSQTKYSIPDDYWDRDTEEQAPCESPTTVDSHDVDVIFTTDPHAAHGYGREKYTAHLVHNDNGATVLFFTKHRWAGNFWRETKELDWRDVPRVVKRQVAAVVACDDVDELAPGHRLVDEGGEHTWKRFGEAADE